MSAFFPALVAQLGEALNLEADEADIVEVLHGEWNLSEHGRRLRRIVWVWSGGSLAASTRPRSRENGGVVQPIYDNLTRVDAYLRAADDAALEHLWTRMLTVVRRQLGTASAPGDYVFRPSQSTAVAGRTDAREMMQSFTWRLSVLEQRLGGGAVVSVLGFDTSYALR